LGKEKKQRKKTLIGKKKREWWSRKREKTYVRFGIDEIVVSGLRRGIEMRMRMGIVKVFFFSVAFVSFIVFSHFLHFLCAFSLWNDGYEMGERVCVMSVM